MWGLAFWVRPHVAAFLIDGIDNQKPKPTSKSLFYIVLQNVSLLPTCNVGTAVTEVVAGAAGEVIWKVVSAATVFSWGSNVVAAEIGEGVSGVVSAATVFSSGGGTGGGRDACVCDG